MSQQTLKGLKLESHNLLEAKFSSSTSSQIPLFRYFLVFQIIFEEELELTMLWSLATHKKKLKIDGSLYSHIY